MNFLKKLGTYALKIIGIASGMMPLVTAAAPSTTGVVDKLGQAFNVVVTAEQMFAAALGPDAKAGSAKLKASVPYIAQLVQQTSLLSGKKPKDETLFEDACTRLTTALADILNSYGD